MGTNMFISKVSPLGPRQRAKLTGACIDQAYGIIKDLLVLESESLDYYEKVRGCSTDLREYLCPIIMKKPYEDLESLRKDHGVPDDAVYNGMTRRRPTEPDSYSFRFQDGSTRRIPTAHKQYTKYRDAQYFVCLIKELKNTRKDWNLHDIMEKIIFDERTDEHYVPNLDDSSGYFLLGDKAVGKMVDRKILKERQAICKPNQRLMYSWG